MFHNTLVMQKIDENCNVEVNYVHGSAISWTYETHIGPTKETNTSMFPIVFYDNVKINSKPKGRETNCQRLNSSTIKFSDDYGVPGGTLICITGPQNYIPSIVKLKSKPTVKYHDFNYEIPTHFEMKSNITSRVSSVVMHVLENTIFTVSVEFTKVDDTYIFRTNRDYNDPFDITLSLIKNKLEYVYDDDIEKMHPALDRTVVKEITSILKDIISDNDLNDSKDFSNDIKQRFNNILPALLATSSSLVTLVDSYNNAGVIGQMLGWLVKALA